MPEADIYQFLSDYFPLRRERVVVELGANRGTDTSKMIRLLKPPFQYYAFEPDPRHWEKLQKLEKALGFQLIKQAVGAVDGQAKFWLSCGKRTPEEDEHEDSSSLMTPTGITEKYPWMYFRPITVPVLTLDAFCTQENISRIDFLWADVQGAEREVIRGGQETFRRVAYFYTECYRDRVYYQEQPTLDEILRILPGQWEIVFRAATDVLLKNTEWVEDE